MGLFSEIEAALRKGQAPVSINKTPTAPPDKNIIPETQPPTSQDPDTCPACGQKQWWHKNEPNSKWICGRCHPPATGLDVILERII